MSDPNRSIHLHAPPRPVSSPFATRSARLPPPPTSPILPSALVSRQFVPMTRIRIEGLLAAFPKLVGTGKQHTYVETENVRYVYQPLERERCIYSSSRTNRATS